MTLGLIRKETPYGEKASRKSLYVIADNMYRFWYRFVPNNSSLIVQGAADLVYKRIEPYFRNLGAGEGTTRLRAARQWSTSWENRIRIPPCSGSANGRKKKWTWVFWNSWWREAGCSLIIRCSCICLPEVDLQKDAWKRQGRWLHFLIWMEH